jgi:hypothetical protein
MISDIYLDVERHLNVAPVTGSARGDENGTEEISDER